jgi:oligopeptide transport system ATP-binding protein
VSEPLLRVEGLTKHFEVKRPGLFRRKVGLLQAVNDANFDLEERTTLGVVGETGSGKSTIARMLTGLELPTSGKIFYQGQNILDLSPADWRLLRREIQMIFQDPYGSLSPRMTVNQLIQEPWLVHKGPVPKSQWSKRTRELLDQVGLPPDAGERHPHQFSGGQRQRIAIARALALEPKLIICDEPVSALDVSIQAQVINLLTQLQRDLGVSYVFIGHDLSVIRHIAHEVAVMYLGRIVELGKVDEVYESPLHPYIKSLLSAVPLLATDDKTPRRKRLSLTGELPSPLDPPEGCNFSTRCWLADDRCRTEQPQLIHRGAGHPNACHYAASLDRGGEAGGNGESRQAEKT